MALPTPTPTFSLATTLQHVVREATSTVTSAPSTTTSPVYFLTSEYITLTGFTSPHVTMPDNTITLVLPTCIQTLQPDANGYLPAGTCNAIWNYYPSFSGSLVFLILFGLLTVAHVYQAAAYKKKFCWVIAMASLWETLAYLFRSFSARHQTTSGIYIVYQIFIMISPLWVNAFAHMTFARMVYAFTPSGKIFSIPALGVSTLFVSFDIIAAIIQIVGVVTASPGTLPEDRARATDVYMGGMGLQLLFILVFLAFAIKFHREVQQFNAGGYKKSSSSTTWRSSWRSLLFAIYASLACITVRIIYRFAELPSVSNEVKASVTTGEGYFWALEAAPMFIAILAFNIVHPGVALVEGGAHMPGLFSTCLALVRGRKGQKEFMELPPKYEELGRKS